MRISVSDPARAAIGENWIGVALHRTSLPPRSVATGVMQVPCRNASDGSEELQSGLPSSGFSLGAGGAREKSANVPRGLTKRRSRRQPNGAAAVARDPSVQLCAVAESGLQPTRRAALRSMSRRARYLILRTASSRESQANWLASWAESVMTVLSDSARKYVTSLRISVRVS